MKRWIWCGILLGSWLGVRTPAAKHVTVRLMDVRNGRPVANKRVIVQFFSGATHLVQVRRLDGNTASDGTVAFPIPEPMPPFIVATATTELYACYTIAPLDTERILRDGILSRCSKPGQGCRCRFKGQLVQHVREGEIILPVRPFTWDEKLLSHLPEP